LDKLKNLKETSEELVYKDFLAFKDLLIEAVSEESVDSNQMVVPMLNTILNMLHTQCLAKQMESDQSPNQWLEPFSEMSRIAQFSFLVEYKLGAEEGSIQLNLPLLYKLSSESFTAGKKFSHVLKNDIRRYAHSMLKEQGISEDACEEIHLKLVNQPEIFIAYFEGDFAPSKNMKDDFYRPGRAFNEECKALDLF
jgi:hypothetical protein